ncbi:MAG TPA: hypothetical protein VG820_06740 [Fimbriimonadaceae bacterium]|nr:hypothetical protein [Fimbriimonadaceae bacterium]
MKIWLAAIGFFVLLLAFGPGCGGGGTDGSNGSNGTNGSVWRYALEATLNGSMIDPTNIQQGETVQFVIAGYTTSNQRIVQSVSAWSTDPTGDSEGTLSANGSYTASASGGQFTVTGTVSGVDRTGPARVRPPGQALVTGRVVDGYGGAVYGVEIDFYAGATLVGTAIAQGDGTFRASVPDTATLFEIKKSTIQAGYYKEYLYNNKWYLPSPSNCMAPLPSLTNGQTTALVGSVVIPPTSHNGSSLPPPPPPICN